MQIKRLVAITFAATVAAGFANAETLNLADLADGETRVLGTGEKTVTATRTGDIVNVTLAKPGADPKVFDCDITTDTCKVDVDHDANKIQLMVMRVRTAGEGETEITEDIEIEALGGSGHKVFVIDRGDGHGEHVMRLHTMPEHGKAMFISDDDEQVDLETLQGLKWVAEGESLGHHIMFKCCGDGKTCELHGADWTGEGVEVVDLKDLTDGETRIFGEDENTISATRNGDTVWLTIAHEGEEAKTMQCDLTTDSCKVIVHEDEESGSTKLMLMKRTTAGDIDLEGMMGGSADGHFVIIEKTDDGSGNIVIEKRLRRVEEHEQQ